MVELPPSREQEIPRWVQVPIGLTLGLVTLLCGFASLSLLLVPPEKNPGFGVAVGLVLFLVCLWVLEKCLRLLTGHKNQGGLMAPRTLRIVSLLFLVLPVAALCTGYYRRMGQFAIGQAVSYFLTFFTLNALASKRQAEGNRSANNISVQKQ
jgi:hypothetical protein